jgi:hypothetical protein
VQSWPVIIRVGPATTSHTWPAPPGTTLPYRIEIETTDGPGVLTVMPDAAKELMRAIDARLRADGRL